MPAIVDGLGGAPGLWWVRVRCCSLWSQKICSAVIFLREVRPRSRNRQLQRFMLSGRVPRRERRPHFTLFIILSRAVS